MAIDTSAAYASTLRTLQGQSQFQTGQLRQNAQQQQQDAVALVGGTVPAANGGRGQVVDTFA